MAGTAVAKEGDYLYGPADFANDLGLDFDFDFEFDLAISFSLGFKADLIMLNLTRLALQFAAAVEEPANPKGLGKIIKKAATSGYRPAAEVDKHINYYIDDRKVPIDRKFTSYKPANPSTSKEKN